jgi:ribosomal protein S18 acetylase RimI-like enzyme
MAIQIRRGSPADIDALQRVASRAWHAAHEPIIGEEAVEEFLNDYYDAESFRAEIGDEDTVFAVAADGDGGAHDADGTRDSDSTHDSATADGADSPVGFVSARPTEDDPAVFDLGRIYVLPERWGEGIGRRLLSHAEETIADRGGERVRLGVMADNERAVAFYESADYERVGEFYDERIATQGYTYEKRLTSGVR